MELNTNNAEYHYNIGLLYVDMGNKEEAIRHAELVYEGGYPLIARIKESH